MLIDCDPGRTTGRIGISDAVGDAVNDTDTVVVGDTEIVWDTDAVEVAEVVRVTEAETVTEVDRVAEKLPVADELGVTEDEADNDGDIVIDDVTLLVAEGEGSSTPVSTSPVGGSGRAMAVPSPSCHKQHVQHTNTLREIQ